MSELAFCSGVALLALMMLSSAALLFGDIIDAAIDQYEASAESLICRDGHACEQRSEGVGLAPGPESSTTEPEAGC